nr:MAG TPA: hypothetical protein [Caudoviricetes sp.]
MEYLSRIPAFLWGDGLRHFVDFLFYRGDEYANDDTGRREAGRML